MLAKNALKSINELITSLIAASGPLSDLGASSVAEHLVRPSLLDALDRATMNDSAKRTVEPLLFVLAERILDVCRGTFAVLHLFV